MPNTTRGGCSTRACARLAKRQARRARRLTSRRRRSHPAPQASPNPLDAPRQDTHRRICTLPEMRLQLHVAGDLYPHDAIQAMEARAVSSG